MSEDRPIQLILEGETDLSRIDDEKLRKVRNKINRELEDEEGLTMDMERIIETDVRDLTGPEAIKAYPELLKQLKNTEDCF